MDTAIKITAIVYIIIAIVIIGSCSISKDTSAPIVRKEISNAHLYLITNKTSVREGDIITLNIPNYKQYSDLAFFVEGLPISDVEFWGENNVKLHLPLLNVAKPHLYAIYNAKDTTNKIVLQNMDYSF